MSETIDVKKVDIRTLAFPIIKNNNVPGWEKLESEEDIVAQHVSGAMTNIIYKMTFKGSPVGSLLFRVYGFCTDYYFDRKKEVEYFATLSDAKFGVTLITTFKGGRLEKWEEGYEPMVSADVKNPKFMTQIAHKAAEMHRIVIKDADERDYFKRLHKWARIASEICTKEIFADVDLALMRQEVEDLERIYLADELDIVFGHHDLQHANILYNAAKDQTMFVDFEYSGIMPSTVDIANYFSEWTYDYYQETNSHLLDMNKFPTKEQIHCFLKEYLAARFDEEPTEAKIEHYAEMVNKHLTCIHLHWVLWALLQKQLSSIDWDYWAYFEERWGFYTKWKKDTYGADTLPVYPKAK